MKVINKSVDNFLDKDSFIKLKNQEWNKFTNHLSEWEIENTMDI